jgi:AcrR family transcriptional regulator
MLDSALEVFVAQGYHAAAMDDIAERAGVSKPVLYQHFPGKLDLYLALLDQNVESLGERVRNALAATDDNKQRVEGCIAAYFEFVDDPGGAFRLVFESDLRNEPMVRERVDRALQRSVEAIADTIARDTGLDRALAELLSCGLAGAAEISARWWLDAGGRVDKQSAIELIQALAWRGISGYPLVASPPSA